MRIYFMGVCGTAMGNAALMLRSMGFEVCGADTGMYPPMSDLLLRSGIELYEGYDALRLASLKPDLVVVGNVTSRGHVEMEWLLETRAFRYTSLPSLLSELILSKRKNIVVAGTHGKTTTSTITAFLLSQIEGVEPGYLIGGVPCDLPSGATSGVEGGAFVIEGDEYDSAFFDKRSKFIHYLPNVLALNNLEFDHADIFRDLQDVERTFRHLIRLVPRNGHIVLNGEDENLCRLFPVDWTTVSRVGCAGAGTFDLEIAGFRESCAGTEFQLIWRGRQWANIHWKMSGLFNARNAAMAALSAGLLLYPEDPTRLDLSALSRFRGVKRRQEVLFEVESLKLIEDFGHHPSALRETLVSLRSLHPDWVIHACFEPRSNTARLRVFQDALVDAFAAADKIYFGAVHRAEKMALSERLDTGELCEAINRRYPQSQAKAFALNTELLTELQRNMSLASGESASNKPQLFVFFSNGSFDGIMQQCVACAATLHPNRAE